MPETRLSSMTDRIAAMQDFRLYKELHWEGAFEEYLAIVRESPQVTRNAYQRLYDMIISYGDRGVHRQQEEARPLQLLQGRADGRAATRSSGSTSR